MANRLKNSHPLYEFHNQQIAEKLKAKQRKKLFWTALEWIAITISIGVFLWIVKTF